MNHNLHIKDNISDDDENEDDDEEDERMYEKTKNNIDNFSNLLSPNAVDNCTTLASEVDKNNNNIHHIKDNNNEDSSYENIKNEPASPSFNNKNNEKIHEVKNPQVSKEGVERNLLPPILLVDCEDEYPPFYENSFKNNSPDPIKNPYYHGKYPSNEPSNNHLKRVRCCFLYRHY